MYNTDGKFKFSLDEKSSFAFNIAVAPDSKFYVTTLGHKYVTVYSPQGRFVSEFSAVSPDGVKSSSEKSSPLLGLAINTQNQLLVGVERWPSKYISIHNLNSSNLVSHVNSIKAPVRPWYIASTKHNNIVISAGASNTSVHVIDINGKPLVTIDGIPGVDGWSPVGLCVSLNDEICIADDGDKCIHCFSMDGKYLKCLYKGLQRPRGMVLMDEDKKLLVAEYHSHSVKMLKLTM